MQTATLAARPQPLYQAWALSGKVQHELEIASAELGVTNAALQQNLPAAAKEDGDVARALAQNVVLEDKVQEAAGDLQLVTEMLEEEVQERKRLEHELAAARSGSH